MEDVLTAAGQLAVASEFRLVYWHTKSEYLYLTVRRGRRAYEKLWAVCDTDEHGHCWTGEDWSFHCRGADAFKFELEEALRIAKELALAKNQYTIDIMESRFPGDYRGGPFDLAAGGWT